MSAFTLTRSCAAPPASLWATVTDYRAYARWIPLTSMRVDEGAPRPGWGFAGLTGLGPLRFADSMVITDWEPPTADAGAGRFRLVKTGRLLAGWADVRVRADGTGSRLDWAEEIVLRPLPVGRLLQPLTDRGNTVMFGRALDAMVAAAERRR